MQDPVANSNLTSTRPALRVPDFLIKREPWSKVFFSSLKNFLTERPVKLPRNASGAVFTAPGFGAGFLENLKEWWRPAPRLAGRASGGGLLVTWKPGYRQFWENLRDAIAPPKLPALRLTSKPVKVRDIWAPNEQFKRAQAVSMTFHALLAVLVAVPFIHVVTQASPVQVVKVDTVDISPYLAKLPPGNDKAGGGGGGGERMQQPPTKGRLPKFSMTQLTPPMATVRNLQPKLPAEPTVIVPPEIRVPNPPLPNYGDPLAQLITGSGGPGGGGGIGAGCCGGVGSGQGRGVGPGEDWGIGGGPPGAGHNGYGYPVCIYCPSPSYSDEAVKAKYQGSVIVQFIVTPDGRATNITVVKGLGVGLDEKVIEAVRKWQLTPARGPDGRPAAVRVSAEVTFRLL